MRHHTFGILLFTGLVAAFVSTVGVVEAQKPKTTNDGVFTDAQAARGKAIYEQRCTTCHGSTLEGVEMAPPLTGSEFEGNWNKAQLSDLFDRIRVTMPADEPGSLGRQKSADVTSYILSFNKFKSGATEMPLESEVLRSITIVRE
jgi:mono/diheme cytochrome c family protein